MNLDYAIDVVKEHSGTIFSGIAVAGVFSTAYFSGKAAVQVDRTIDPDLDTKEKIKVYAKAYWKTAVSAVVTCACIIGSDRIHVGKEISLAAAAAMLKKQLDETNDKIVEEVGEDKAKEIHREIIKKRVEKKKTIDVFDNIPNVSKENKFVMYDHNTDQYFYTTKETVMFAIMELNKHLMSDREVRYNSVIAMLGGEKKPEGERLRWCYDDEDQFESYYQIGDSPWIDIWPDVYENGGHDIFALFFSTEPQLDIFDNMIYREET